MPRRSTSRSRSPTGQAVIYDPATLEFETPSPDEFDPKTEDSALTKVETNGRSLVDIYLNVGPDRQIKAYFTTVDLSKLPLPVRWSRKRHNIDHIYVRGES